MRNKVSLVCIALGALLILAAAVMCIWLLVENHSAAVASQSMAEQIAIENVEVTKDKNLPPYRQEIPDYILDPSMQMPVISVDGYDCIGVLEIPRLDKKLPVITQWSYENLRVAPCRYDGSAYDGSLIIAAHNYVAHFGSLATMQIGDRVRFIDADGNVFSYDVTEVGTILPSDVDLLKEGDWDLTLFTCTFGNTYRVVVRCKCNAT